MMDATKENQETPNGSVFNDSDDDFESNASLEGDWTSLEGEGSLETTTEAEAGVRPGAVDDFLRNFLYQADMTETLDCFQAEWAQKMENGPVDAERLGAVPSVYTENQRLASELKRAKREREEYRAAASAAAQTLRRVQKARDLRRMQYTRVLQEKTRLIEEMRKFKAQCDSFEPALKRMNDKYQALVKQTVLLALDRDKAAAQSAEHSALFCHDPTTPTSADGAMETDAC